MCVHNLRKTSEIKHAKRKPKPKPKPNPKKINQEKNSCRNQTWKQKRPADYNRPKLMKALEGD